ncbi:MAG TPA: hypothetical protein PKC18_18215, partial [Lacipirellulaceae bacterium]|nr:hypothetical protein [Lacipirellulaceae bacterium]
MSKIRCATAMAVGLMAATAASSGRATVLFSADFQADVPGTPPAIVGNVLQNGTTTQVTTTSAGTDPFGVA